MKLKPKYTMLAALLIAGFAIGCAQKNDGAAQAETYRVTSADVNEYNQLAIEVQLLRPNSNSTDTQINSYESKLNRMAELHQRLRNHNNRNGVIVRGDFAATEQVMEQGRAAIRAARANRTRTGVTPTTTGVQEFENLGIWNNQDFNRAELLGEPGPTWTSTRLNQYIATVDRIPDRIARQLELLRRRDSSSETISLTAQLESLKARLEANLALANMWRDAALARERGR